jgi:hypothetical protein
VEPREQGGLNAFSEIRKTVTLLSLPPVIFISLMSRGCPALSFTVICEVANCCVGMQNDITLSAGKGVESSERALAWQRIISCSQAKLFGAGSEVSLKCYFLLYKSPGSKSPSRKFCNVTFLC